MVLLNEDDTDGQWAESAKLALNWAVTQRVVEVVQKGVRDYIRSGFVEIVVVHPVLPVVAWSTVHYIVETEDPVEPVEESHCPQAKRP
jgi:hypothetical protein